jgi:uncharacterized membrane protein YccF (DUF307 family)
MGGRDPEPGAGGTMTDMTEVPGDRSGGVPPAPPASPPPAQPQPPAGAPAAPVVVFAPAAGPGLLVRALWFFFIGTWLSWLAIAVAYLCCLTIVGLPVGFWIFNRLPVILTLRPRTDIRMTQVVDGITYVSGGGVAQRPLWLRAIWFVLVGWWFGAIYMAVAWLLCVILITLPVGLWLFNRVGAVMTLLRY